MHAAIECEMGRLQPMLVERQNCSNVGRRKRKALAWMLLLLDRASLYQISLSSKSKDIPCWHQLVERWQPKSNDEITPRKRWKQQHALVCFHRLNSFHVTSMQAEKRAHRLFGKGRAASKYWKLIDPVELRERARWSDENWKSIIPPK